MRKQEVVKPAVTLGGFVKSRLVSWDRCKTVVNFIKKKKKKKKKKNQLSIYFKSKTIGFRFLF